MDSNLIAFDRTVALAAECPAQGGFTLHPHRSQHDHLQSRCRRSMVNIGPFPVKAVKLPQYLGHADE